MQKRKKRLLGLVGLVLVGVITAIAFAIPSPDASAVDTGSVSISVTVKDNDDEDPNNPGGSTHAPKVNIVTIDGVSTNNGNTIVTVKRQVKVEVSYSRADNVDIELKDSQGNVVGRGRCGSYDSTTNTCSATITLDNKYLAKDPQNGDVLTVVATAVRNSTGQSATDSAEFIYRAAYLYNKGEHQEKTGNPIIYAVLNSEVKYATIQIYNSDGKVVFEQPFTLSYADVDPITGEYKLTLPFKENNLPAGKYTAVLMAYSTEVPSEDSLISVSVLTDIIYNPEGGPLTPDTGSNVFRNLNISRADYLLTGLLAFGAVIIFAIILIVRRNKR